MRISHEVSAISVQPWQEAPCSQRASIPSAGECWAQTGSLEQSAPRAQSDAEVGGDVAGLSDEPAEGALGVGARGVEQHREAACLVVDVDPFANGARRVAAAHRDGADEEVREGVEQHVRTARERAVDLALRSPPHMTLDELVEAGSDLRAVEPVEHRVGVELHEQPFAVVLDSGEPLGLDRELGAGDVGVELAVDVGDLGLEAGEADQREHLAQAMELDHGRRSGR